MILTEPTELTLEKLTLEITKEIHVRAPLAVAFEALLEEMGPGNETPDGKPLSMKLEPWPGGRWYRDLGNGDGHLWAHVQSIKKPTLLELTGPLFMSFAAVSNVQYRLAEMDGGTRISFRHSALGFLPEDFKKNIASGWVPLLERAKKRAEATRPH